jgi:ribonuclease BN (tRNA processing enzyme)
MLNMLQVLAKGLFSQPFRQILDFVVLPEEFHTNSLFNFEYNVKCEPLTDASFGLCGPVKQLCSALSRRDILLQCIIQRQRICNYLAKLSFDDPNSASAIVSNFSVGKRIKLSMFANKSRAKTISYDEIVADPRDPILSFMGTGCASPSKHRGNSCIILHAPLLSFCDRKCMIIDAGESCLSQMYQYCSGETAAFSRLLRSIRMIWISHHHADHHCGLSMLLAECIKFRVAHEQNIIVVIAPVSVIQYHEYALCIAGIEDNISFIPIENTLPGKVFFTKQFNDLQIASLTSVRVPHCKNSFGLILKFYNSMKFVFSGDCRPSNSLIAEGHGCDLLVHEATFADALASDAITKRHCTISEAIGVGRQMNAQHIVLTHFSQRYAKCPQVNFITPDISLSFAFDFLNFSFPSQLPYVAIKTQEVVKFMENITNSEKEDHITEFDNCH